MHEKCPNREDLYCNCVGMPRIIFLCKSENGEADFNSRGRIAEKNMIKKRLVGLLSHAKKYIGFQVFWQWLALIAQMTAVFSIAELLERVLYGLSDPAFNRGSAEDRKKAS